MKQIGVCNGEKKKEINMMAKNNIKKLFVVIGALGALLLLPTCRVEAKEKKQTKIHFISLNSSTDAILLESNGHFGMVDSGEDWDYPDGSDDRYPLRSGITKGKGYEQQVIHYLETLGVKKLDFYIATHSHSDHIGSGDEILDAIPTERLYINRYDDQYMTNAHGTDPKDPYYNENAQEYRLWDNQYVYDNLILAAKKNGTEIITDLDQEKNKKYCSFTLGDMSIELMNVERRKDEYGQVIPVADENDNCIVTKVTALGRTALLTADLDPTEGDTKKVADRLIEELWSEEQYKSEKAFAKSVELEKNYPTVNYAEKSDVDLDLPETRAETPEVDESKKTLEKQSV